MPKKKEQQEKDGQQEQPKKRKTTSRNEKGQFTKGCAKPEGSGRKAGTKNKYGNIRDRLKEIIMPYLETDPDNIEPGAKSLATDLMKIADPNDRVHAVAAILPYVVPKYTSTTITADANRPISEEEHLLVKAADKLCAYIKCIEEEKSGNGEFRSAKATTLASLNAMPCPELHWFMEQLLPTFSCTIDELQW